MFSDTPVRICTAEDVGFIIFKMTFLVKGVAILPFIFTFSKRG